MMMFVVMQTKFSDLNDSFTRYQFVNTEDNLSQDIVTKGFKTTYKWPVFRTVCRKYKVHRTHSTET